MLSPETVSIIILFYLILIVAALVAVALLGYRAQGQIRAALDALVQDSGQLVRSIHGLQYELQGQLADLRAALETSQQRVIETEKQIVDDLNRIDGINPTSQRKLRAAGIRRFRQLADATPEQLAAILQVPE